MNISRILNAEDLFPYWGTFEPSSLSTNISTETAASASIHVTPHIHPSYTSQIEAILDDRLNEMAAIIAFLINGGEPTTYWCYLDHKWRISQPWYNLLE